MHVDVGAGKIAQRFSEAVTFRFENEPGLTAGQEPIPCNGRAEFERHVEARCGRVCGIDLDAGEVMNGVAAFADELHDAVKASSATRDLQRGSWRESVGVQANDT